MGLLSFMSEPNSILNMGCLHHMACYCGVWQPPGVGAPYRCLAPFSVAPWWSLEYQIPRGAEGIGGKEELRRWTHVMLNVNLDPWELDDLWRNLASRSLLCQ